MTLGTTIILATDITVGRVGTTHGKEMKKSYLLVVAKRPQKNSDDVEADVEVHSLNNETLPTCLQIHNKSGLEQMTYPKQPKVNFPPLPIDLHNHCLISLDDTVNDFLLIGGKDSKKDASNKTFIYRSASNEWVQMADMHKPRSEITCGPVRSRIGGPVEKVVVSGGRYLEPLSAEMYNVKENTWESVDDMPVRETEWFPGRFRKWILYNPIVVPYEKTFLVFGGYFCCSSRSGGNNEVFKFEESTKSWITMPFQLSVAHEFPGIEKAMLVSPDMFPSC